MRLTAREQKCIVANARRLDPQVRVWLYGSRTQDELKGGDIDLLLISETLEFGDKLTFLVELKMDIGDQKIDVVIKHPDDVNGDAFVLSVLPHAIELTA